MTTQQKILIGVLATGVLLLGGCAQSRYSSTGPWRWSPPARLAAGNSGSSGAVIASPVENDAQYFAYAPGQAPEFDRRDGSMNIRSTDPTSGWLGWPEEQRASLDYPRSFHTGSDPDRFVYPSTSARNYPIAQGRSRSYHRHEQSHGYGYGYGNGYGRGYRGSSGHRGRYR